MHAASVRIEVEDRLSEAVMIRLVREIWSDWHGSLTISINDGVSQIKAKIDKLNEAAKFVPIIVLADLDNYPCAGKMKIEWFPSGESNKMIFRIAVREIESWLLADHAELPKFLGVSATLLPRNPDQINDPKNRLIQLSKRSRNRVLREGIVPRIGSGAKIGPAYNDILAEFADTKWSVVGARKASDSLNRACVALEKRKSLMIS